GTYHRDTTFVLTDKDSGEPNRSVVYRAFPNETVKLSGSVPLNGSEAVTDSALLARLQPETRSQLVRIDLTALGLTNLGRILPQGFGSSPFLPIEPEPICNERVLTLARYPNSGWLRIESVPQDEALPKHMGNSGELIDGIPAGRHYGRFVVGDPRIGQWLPAKDIWMHGYWTWDWADTYQEVAGIDPQTGTIYPAEPFHRYGFRKGQRFYFRNILEELDEPGEYYIDRQTGLLYFWPPVPIAQCSLQLTVLDQEMIRTEQASHVSFEGLLFENSRTTAIRVQGGRIRIAGCTFRNLGNTAVIVDGGHAHEIISNDFHDLAGGGIRAFAGDRPTLKSGDLLIENNHFYHFGRLFRTYQPAIQLAGVGNRVSHNLIHDAPHMGMSIDGNEHVIEFNEFHTLAQETGDVGAVYIGRDWTQRNNLIRYNYFHHLHAPGLHGINAVYLDDFSSGQVILGNIFYRTDRGAFIGGGRDNRVENNLFIDCTPSVHVDSRGLGWASGYFDGRHRTLNDRMEAINFRQPPYSERYPKLLDLYKDDPARAKNNRITKNVSVGGRWMDIYDGLTLSDLVIENNLISDSAPSRWSSLDDHETTDSDRTFFHFGTPEAPPGLKTEANLSVDDRIGLERTRHGRFALADGSVFEEIGFESIPAEKIGLYIDGYRRHLPAALKNDVE
ncbi:right-handed parallel beta-helix repeat-containing protein, partial [candidate division KSB1 bacterium]|nr:right-handed parallel beta-helix repeat-containing protein [candidate division KSB1 bacterium]